MSQELVKAVNQFGVLRGKIFSILHDQIGDVWIGRGYEGVLQITFPSCRDEKNNSGLYTVSLNSCILVAKNSVWSGSTLAEAVDKANKDIDLWHEENTNPQSHIPNSSGD